MDRRGSLASSCSGDCELRILRNAAIPAAASPSSRPTSADTSGDSRSTGKSSRAPRIEPDVPRARVTSRVRAAAARGSPRGSVARVARCTTDASARKLRASPIPRRSAIASACRSASARTAGSSSDFEELPTWRMLFARACASAAANAPSSVDSIRYSSRLFAAFTNRQRFGAAFARDVVRIRRSGGSRRSRAGRPRDKGARGVDGPPPGRVSVEEQRDVLREASDSFACSGVNAVPSGATTFTTPRACSLTSRSCRRRRSRRPCAYRRPACRGQYRSRFL